MLKEKFNKTNIAVLMADVKASFITNAPLWDEIKKSGQNNFFLF